MYENTGESLPQSIQSSYDSACAWHGSPPRFHPTGSHLLRKVPGGQVVLEQLFERKKHSASFTIDMLNDRHRTPCSRVETSSVCVPHVTVSVAAPASQAQPDTTRAIRATTGQKLTASPLLSLLLAWCRQSELRANHQISTFPRSMLWADQGKCQQPRQDARSSTLCNQPRPSPVDTQRTSSMLSQTDRSETGCSLSL